MDSDNEYNSDDIVGDDDDDELDDESITSLEDNDKEFSLNQQESINQEEDIGETNRKKAEALKQQIALWDSLLELRIKLQRATITSNCLPVNFSSDDEDLRQIMEENAMLVRKTLALLLAIETRRSNKRQRDELDENENNSEDKTKNRKDHQTTTDLFKSISKKLKRDENLIDEELDASYDRFAPERDKVLLKWFERTRTFSKQNKSTLPEQSPIVQIKEIMSFPDRLIKRTQTSRMDYDLVCPPSSPNTNENSSDPNSTINPNIFDDGDFYHQILREYIERKTASITDPEQINKHWSQLRKLRNKLKKKVDTKASKDRKIRYNVHKKLVNYMAPIDRCSFSDEAKSDLFSSLFGAAPTTNFDVEPGSPVNDIRII